MGDCKTEAMVVMMDGVVTPSRHGIKSDGGGEEEPRRTVHSIFSLSLSPSSKWESARRFPILAAIVLDQVLSF